MYTSSGDLLCYSTALESNSEIHINRKTIFPLPHNLYKMAANSTTVRSCGVKLNYVHNCLNCASGRGRPLFQRMYCSSCFIPFFYFLPLVPLCEIFHLPFVFPVSWRCLSTALIQIEAIIRSIFCYLVEHIPCLILFQWRPKTSASIVMASVLT
jgi:hypothetical protein